MLFKTVFIALYIALIPILGCGPPEDYIPVSQLVFPGYLEMQCTLGYQCQAKVWFFTDHFYYNAIYYTKDGDLTSLTDCTMSGNWQDLNMGQSNGSVQFIVKTDDCYNQPNTNTIDQYNTVTNIVSGIP
jgi:hypothetical protein